MTFGTWRWWGCQFHAPAAFTPRKCSWYSFSLGVESTPGSCYGRKVYTRCMSLKNPVTPPAIDPGTHRANTRLNYRYSAVTRRAHNFNAYNYTHTHIYIYIYISFNCIVNLFAFTQSQDGTPSWLFLEAVIITCMKLTNAECTVGVSRWLAKKLPETCRVLWQNKSG